MLGIFRIKNMENWLVHTHHRTLIEDECHIYLQEKGYALEVSFFITDGVLTTGYNKASSFNNNNCNSLAWNLVIAWWTERKYFTLEYRKKEHTFYKQLCMKNCNIKSNTFFWTTLHIMKKWDDSHRFMLTIYVSVL